MTPDLRELRYFVGVAEELSFTRAAQRLHVSQPALSATIRQLETRLGVELLHRTTRKVELTPAGKTLLVHARTVLDATVSLDGALREHRDGGSAGRLRVGLHAHGAGALTLPILRAFEAAHPAVELEVGEVGPATLVNGLLDGYADVLIAPGAVDDARLETTILFHEPRTPFADCPVALVTRKGERNPIVAAFREIAERVTADQPHLATPLPSRHGVMAVAA
jgi:LysR family transcriptional regulator, benzoate and cis,cis-muconate-responsive activator of ben and cat genes